MKMTRKHELENSDGQFLLEIAIFMVESLSFIITHTFVMKYNLSKIT